MLFRPVEDKYESFVFLECQQTRPSRFSTQIRGRAQPHQAKNQTKLESPHPHFEAGSSDTPTTDLSDYLIKK